MYRRPYRRTHHRTQQTGLSGFLRRPAVQIGILVITVLIILVIALTAGK